MTVPANSHETDTARPVVADLAGAVALALYTVTASASFAALIFAGPAADGLPQGATTFLFASGVLAIILGLRTRFRLAFSHVQDTAAIVLVPTAATMVANGSDDPVRDLFVVLAASSLITGVVMLLVGSARLAGAARFMPTTVVAGFLAGTGWLLMKGGVDVMTSRNVGLSDIDDLFGSELVKLWLPGIALGLLIAVVPLVQWLSPIVSSMAVLASTGVFFAIVATFSSTGSAETGGWLLGPFPDGGSIEFVGGSVGSADWSAVGSVSGQLGVVVVLSLLGVLLNISAIQALVRQRIDLDAELRTAGLANLVIAPLGGLVGYHGLGNSVLADRLDVRRKWVPIVVGVITVGFALVGAEIVGYLPRFVAGGLLVGAGLGLLISWVSELRFTHSWFDRTVSLAILATICFVGILEGIVVGVVAACLFFVVRYSRIDAVRLESDGRQRRSVVERSPAEEEHLEQFADRLVVYELHGSLFFGSVSGIASTVRHRLGSGGAPVETVILDFARVADIDSSAFTVLVELADDISTHGAALIWSSLSADATVVLGRLGGLDHATVTEDLDAGLEHAENRQLDMFEGRTNTEHPVEPFSDALLEWLSFKSYRPGEVIVREGDPSDELLVVTAGAVRITHTSERGHETRLRTLRAGALLGEIGFLTGVERTASVIAETDVEVRSLSVVEHQRLRLERPDLTLELYDRVLSSTAARASAISGSLNQALR